MRAWTVDGALVANVTEMGFDSSLAVARQMLLASERPDAILAASDMYAARRGQGRHLRGASAFPTTWR